MVAAARGTGSFAKPRHPCQSALRGLAKTWRLSIRALTADGGAFRADSSRDILVKFPQAGVPSIEQVSLRKKRRLL
jgi:hypothetical protein